MKIKAVASGKDKSVPRGTPIEFGPNEKVPLAVIDAVVKHKFENPDWMPVVTKNDVTVDKMTHAPKANIRESKYQCNAYTAQGSVTIWFRDTKIDRMRPRKKFKFSIDFEDCLDGWGMPDIKVTRFELK